MSAFIMKFGVNYLRPATVGTASSLSLTGMSKFTGGGTRSRSDQLPVRSYGAQSLLRGARIFTSSGNGLRKTSWNPDCATTGQGSHNGWPTNSYQSWFQFDRTPRRHRHYCYLGGSSSSRPFARQSQSTSHCLPKQPQTTQLGLEYVRRRQQRLAGAEQSAELLPQRQSRPSVGLGRHALR